MDVRERPPLGTIHNRVENVSIPFYWKASVVRLHLVFSSNFGVKWAT